MNALYVCADGTLVDPLGGLEDLRARRFVFIDDAGQRIREDYLRILRFFRFNAWYGDPNAGLDPEALAAISENAEGIRTLSKERIGAEIRKLLTAPDPAPAVAAMRQSGVLTEVIVGADDKALAPLVHFEEQINTSPDAIRRLAILGGQAADTTLRLSKKEAAKLVGLKNAISDMTPLGELAYRKDSEFATSVALLRSAIFEQPLPVGFDDEIARGVAAKFPVSSADLIDKFQGPELGAKLSALEDRWVRSGFTLDRDALLNE
jgi:poly(A) polymerase